MNLALNNQTMSSREIAELTSKQVKHIHRDFKSMANELGFPCNDGLMPSPNMDLGFSYEKDSQGRISAINMNQELTLTLVSGYSVKLRSAIIKRWKELESKQAPQLPQSKREWIEFALEQEKKLELAAPKVAFVDNLVDKTNLLTATQVAQKHKLSAIKLNKILEGLKVYNLGVKRTRVFRQWFVDKNYGEMKKNDAGFDNALFTNAGEIWVNEQIIKLGSAKL